MSRLTASLAPALLLVAAACVSSASVTAPGGPASAGSTTAPILPASAGPSVEIAPDEVRLVGLGSDGRPVSANGERPPSLSRDGLVVAFEAGAPGAGSQVYVRELGPGSTMIASARPDGTVPDDTAWRPSISADGRLVAFDAWSAAFVEGDTNGMQDVFVRDVVAQTTIRVSVATDGSQARDGGWLAALSADGSTVAFASSSPDLVDRDTNRASDVFIHVLATGETSRVSLASDGTEGDADSTQPAISADGRVVAFYSSASTLVPGDTNGAIDLFVHDRATGTTTRLSVATDGTQGNANAGPATSCVTGTPTTGGGSSPAELTRCWPGAPPALSADGRLVAFASDADNLVADDTNGYTDVFLHDRSTGSTTIASRRPDGTAADGSSGGPAMSADGRVIAFTSGATNLVEGGGSSDGDVYVVDRRADTIVRASSDASGRAVGGWYPAVSGDGRVVAFLTRSSALAPGWTGYAAVVAVGLAR